ncbi:hypothetical protein BDA99DRAFT_571684 [Phascolomyces articulosus]|uniref:Uncharacterized protein n=1 Tax=Phascolomyces articulosus TaxID=60185 RepID=A0AAD5K147_9FUNG|nr:hypothetical protein BDA99DRAFT_571684 [Phascolomyces articulosus]
MMDGQLQELVQCLLLFIYIPKGTWSLVIVICFYYRLAYASTKRKGKNVSQSQMHFILPRSHQLLASQELSTSIILHGRIQELKVYNPYSLCISFFGYSMGSKGYVKSFSKSLILFLTGVVVPEVKVCLLDPDIFQASRVNTPFPFRADSKRAKHQEANYKTFDLINITTSIIMDDLQLSIANCLLFWFINGKRIQKNNAKMEPYHAYTYHNNKKYPYLYNYVHHLPATNLSPVHQLNVDQVIASFAKVGHELNNRDYKRIVESTSATIDHIKHSHLFNILDHCIYGHCKSGQHEEAIRDAKEMISIAPDLAAALQHVTFSENNIYSLQQEQYQQEFIKGKEAALELSAKRINFVSVLPIEFVDSIFFKRRLHCSKCGRYWKWMTITLLKLSQCCVSIAPSVHHLALSSWNSAVISPFLEAMSNGKFRHIKSFQFRGKTLL